MYYIVGNGNVITVWYIFSLFDYRYMGIATGPVWFTVMFLPLDA